jgi:RimJ/RimL family protein N-acetyltransferase
MERVGLSAVMSSLELRLRPASTEDSEFLYRLYAANRAEEVTAWGWIPEQQEHFLRFQAQAQSHSYRTQFPHATDEIVELDGQPVGRFYLDRRAEEILIVDIAVLPEFQGRGVGTCLLRIPIAEAAGTGLQVWAHVLCSNTRMQSVVERLGFKRVGQNGPSYLYVWQGDNSLPAEFPTHE